jgi:hypothetical protein
MTDQVEGTPITTFTWGVKGAPNYVETTVSDIPVPNLAMLALQGFRHKLGNEVAAKVAAHKKSDEGKAKSDGEIAQYAAEVRKEMLERILTGQLGVRASSGPRLSGDEALRRSVTLTVLKAFLAKHNLKMPTGDGVSKVAGKEMNREALIEAMYRRDKASIDAEVERKKAFEESAAAGAEVGDLFAE